MADDKAAELARQILMAAQNELMGLVPSSMAIYADPKADFAAKVRWLAALLRPHLSASDVSEPQVCKHCGLKIYWDTTYPLGARWRHHGSNFSECGEVGSFRSAEPASASDVSAERERCARIVEKAFSGVGGSSIADRIRRGE